LQPGCISVYIRHGDKVSEAQIFPDEHYEAVIKRLMQTDPALTNQLYLSTKDSMTVQHYVNSRSWRVVYPRITRQTGSDSILSFMAQHGYAMEMLQLLLDVDMAMQCDGFVGSIYSNLGR
jgi:predicted metal-dependent phosphotriesterase family hydrolase